MAADWPRPDQLGEYLGVSIMLIIFFFQGGHFFFFILFALVLFILLIVHPKMACTDVTLK